VSVLRHGVTDQH